MDAIRLNRTTSLTNFVRFLRTIGAPVERGLTQVRLPMLFAERPDAWIPSIGMWRFVDDMARREGVADLGLNAAILADEQGISPALARTLWNSPTLFQALSVLPVLVRRQSSHIQMWHEPHGDEVRLLHTGNLGREMPGHYITTWHTLHLLIVVVRHFVGRDWAPENIYITAPRLQGTMPLQVYPDTRVHVDCPNEAIGISRDLLHVPRRTASASPSAASMPADSGEAPTDFVGSLRSVLRTYILDGYPRLEFTAELLDSSPRSLQRRLAASDMTYSKLVELVRFDAAVAEMEDPDISLTEVALRLGYSEQTAFTRAFRRWAGISPKAFRGREKSRWQAAAEPAFDQSTLGSP